MSREIPLCFSCRPVSDIRRSFRGASLQSKICCQIQNMLDSKTTFEARQNAEFGAIDPIHVQAQD